MSDLKSRIIAQLDMHLGWANALAATDKDKKLAAEITAKVLGMAIDIVKDVPEVADEPIRGWKNGGNN